MVNVAVRDAAKTSEAVTAVTEAGANIVSGPNLSMTDPEATANLAYADAYKAARTRANAYAKAANMEVSRVLYIRDAGGSQGNTYFRAADAISAVRVRARLAGLGLPSVVGHGDWESQNVRWRGGQAVAVHDWDSVVAQPEAAIAGQPAALQQNGTTRPLTREALTDAQITALVREIAPEAPSIGIIESLSIIIWAIAAANPQTI